MLRVIYTQDTSVRDGYVSVLQLTRETVESQFSVYKKEGWILMYSPDHRVDTVLSTILEEWNPDTLYLPSFGRSIDMIHEVGDVILPNVFCTYDPRLEALSDEVEIEDLDVSPRFLTSYSEQKDYYIEDYGLSIGGIVVDHVPADPSLNTRLLSAYEADAYISGSLNASYIVAEQSEVPTIIMVGITDGKPNSKGQSGQVSDIVGNMVTTIRLMEELE